MFATVSKLRPSLRTRQRLILALAEINLKKYRACCWTIKNLDWTWKPSWLFRFCQLFWQKFPSQAQRLRSITIGLAMIYSQIPTLTLIQSRQSMMDMRVRCGTKIRSTMPTFFTLNSSQAQMANVLKTSNHQERDERRTTAPPPPFLKQIFS